MKHAMQKMGALLLGATVLTTQMAAAHSNNDKIKVMSRNIYLGADIFPVIATAQQQAELPPEQQNPIAIPLAVSEVFQTVQATNFPERAQALADEIERRRPHVIGLQEVSQWFIGPADSLVGGTSPATEVVYDYLDILMVALAERDLDYVVASSIDNADLELPMVTGTDATGYPTFADIRLHDRDVILVKNTARVSFSNEYSANFTTNGTVDIAGSEIEFTRGYNMIDVTVRGADYRFVNTHLEVGGGEPYSSLQALQMNELLQVIAATTGAETPVILVGDFNSSPEDIPFESAFGIGTLYPPYLQAMGTGYSDLWLSKKKPKDGFTCCFSAAVSDEEAELYQRIDHIFIDSKGREIAKLKAKVLGDSNADMTDISGLNPSDHAGVFGKIKLKK
ncbi:MAG: endonuclease/exonuclease/phosphatase family metal-dependent hydrolase [Oleiphilaceae bacterium]|jgi:endonuclease/exonuclease/phosphatase family metal-dependent hydrolase